MKKRNGKMVEWKCLDGECHEIPMWEATLRYTAGFGLIASACYSIYRAIRGIVCLVHK